MPRRLAWLVAWLVVLFAGGCSKKMSADAASAPGAYGGAADAERAGSPGASAGTTWKRSTLHDHSIRIEVGDDEVLPVRTMQVRATVDGFRARVLLDIDFDSENPGWLEGTLKLRLPEGASPYFLAFGPQVVESAPLVIARDPDAPAPDRGFAPAQIMAERASTWEGPKVAKMVGRDQAAAAYRGTVRRRVDPAISEWGGAGVFNTRLYPIEGGRTHRVVIGYDVDLVQLGDTWHLPLHLPAGIDRRVLEVDAATPGRITAALAGDKGSEHDGRTRFVLDDPDGELFELEVHGDVAPALRGVDVAGTRFVAARLQPEIPAIAAKGSRRAVFAVDVSMSANPDQFNVWLDLLRATLERNRGDIDEFAVLFFDVEAFWWDTKFVANTPAQVDRLMDDAGELALEGATDLGAALGEAAAPAWLGKGDSHAWDIFLLSDGAATWGEGSTDRIAVRLREQLDGRVFAYRTGLPGGDPVALDKLVRTTGGAVFSVAGADEVAAVATAHRREAWELVRITAPGIDDVVIAGAPRFVFPGQSLTLAGRVVGELPDQVRLELRRGAATRTIAVAMPPIVDSELASRVYGQIATQQLEEFADAGGVDALPYARHFRITGRSASLLMLDSEADYASFGITPEIETHDAAFVKEQPAANTIARARVELARLLGDPRRELLARVRRIAGTQRDGIPFRRRIEGLVEQLPDRAFTVDVPPLHCESHAREAVGAELSAQLSTHELDYDTVVADAERRRTRLSPEDGLKALSSLVEANPGDTVMARDVAFIAADWGLSAQTYHLLQRVAAARPDEPQTYHALALGLAELGAHDLALLHFELALAGEWDPRFGEFHDIVAMDYRRFLQTTPASEFATPRLARERLADLREASEIEEGDLVVMITWNTDNTDVDLHVVEPSGAECFYGNRKTLSGGRLTQDVTQGYGPEMYTIKRARHGRYKIFAHYFAADRNRLSTRTKVYATIYEDFGTAKEKVTRKTVPLRDGKSVHDIAVVKF